MGIGESLARGYGQARADRDRVESPAGPWRCKGRARRAGPRRDRRSLASPLAWPDLAAALVACSLVTARSMSVVASSASCSYCARTASTCPAPVSSKVLAVDGCDVDACGVVSYAPFHFVLRDVCR